MGSMSMKCSKETSWQTLFRRHQVGLSPRQSSSFRLGGWDNASANERLSVGRTRSEAVLERVSVAVFRNLRYRQVTAQAPFAIKLFRFRGVQQSVLGRMLQVLSQGGLRTFFLPANSITTLRLFRRRLSNTWTS